MLFSHLWVWDVQIGTLFSFVGLGRPCGHFGTLFEIFFKKSHLWVNRTFFSFVGLGRRCGHFETIAMCTPPLQQPEASFCEILTWTGISNFI